MNIPAEVLEVLKKFFGTIHCHEVASHDQSSRRFEFTGLNELRGWLYSSAAGWRVVVNPDELTKSTAPDGRAWVFVQHSANQELFRLPA